MVKKIPLSKEMYALVDDEDYNELSKYYWRVMDSGIQARKVHYAVRQEGTTKRKSFLMHRVIMNAPVGYDVDHINGDGLDNRRSNLRVVTRRENSQNQHIKRKSKYVGVTYDKRPNIRKHWYSRIHINGKTIHLGSFLHEKDAGKAYDSKLIEMGYEPVNFPGNINPTSIVDSVEKNTSKEVSIG